MNDPLQDPLDIQQETNAFAQLIAGPKTGSPLSIALFAPWGAGKTFFLRKIQDNVRTNQDTSACRHIAQIEYNAAEYANSNPEFSLLKHILQNLRVAGLPNDPYEARIRALIAALEREKLGLQENQIRVKILEEHENEIKNKQKETEIWKIYQKLRENKKLEQEVGVVLDKFMPGLNQKVQNIRTEFDDEKLLSNLDKYEGELQEVSGLLQTIRKKAWIGGIAILAFFLLMSGATHIYAIIADSVWMQSFLNFIQNGYLYLLSLLAPVLELVRRYWKIIKPLTTFSSGADELRKKVRELPEAEKHKIKKLSQELEETRSDKQNIETRIKKHDEHLKNTPLQELLDEFLKQRRPEQAGISANIRGDFELLARLASAGTLPSLDRIALYIDDLDHCSPEYAARTLDALRLFLGFEGFVTVVAIEENWLRKCLKLEHPGLFSGETAAPKLEQYIEKIFQISFRLRPMQPIGRQNLIRRYLKNEEQRAAIRPDELQFLEQLAPLLGDSPYKIKRYVDTYRFLKTLLSAHEAQMYFETPASADGFDPPVQNCRIVMLLLAVGLNLPELARFWFREFQNLALLKYSDVRAGVSDAIAKGGTNRRLEGEFSALDAWVDGWKTARDLGDADEAFQLEQVRSWASLVSRFQFHDL